jgi:predicted negative regulator of RcsB-dependent stress response
MEASSPPSAGFYNFLGWIETNKKRLGIGAGVAVVVVLAVSLWLWYGGEQKRAAEEALSSVRAPFSPGEVAAPGTAEALLKVAADYPNTPAASKAMLRAGTTYFDQGQFTKAQQQFETALRDRTFGESPWVPQAVFGIAASFDAQGKDAEAIAKYNDFIRSYGNDPSAEQARLNVARLYEKTKQPALALDVLKKMTENQQQGFTPAMSEAQERIREIYAKNPSLVPPPPPMTPPVTTPTITQFSNVVRPPTNVISLTNLLRKTNAASAPVLNQTGAAPKIIINPATPNAGK